MDQLLGKYSYARTMVMDEMFLLEKLTVAMDTHKKRKKSPTLLTFFLLLYFSLYEISLT